MPRMAEPSDLGYRTDLLSLTGRVHGVIRNDLDLWLRAWGRTDSVSDEVKALFARIRLQTEDIVAVAAPRIARRFVKDGAEANRRAMNAQFRHVIKIEPFVGNTGLAAAMDVCVSTNVDLISSIPTELLTDVEAVVRPAVTSGVRVEELMRQVQGRFDVSESRAQLIARDQVGKWNGQLARERQEQLGITEYTWSTSKDIRVRVDHEALEGQVFQYSQPPIVDVRTGRTANPGEDYQCRCQALPRVAALLDALGIPDDLDDVVIDAE